MSLGLKEVLSTNTDFVSRKDDSLKEIYDNSENRSYYAKLTELFDPKNTIDENWMFSGSKKNEEIEIVAKALVQQEIANLEGATEVEDLSKEAQTIFSDIAAWMLERKMRDHEDSIATDNENAEWRESLAELTVSVISTARSFGLLSQNKEHRTEYRKRFLNEKIKEKEDLLEKYAQTKLPPLKYAENELNNIIENPESIQKNLNRFKSEFIDIFNINHADNNLLRFQNNLQYINSHETLKKMYGTGPTQVTAGRKWSENTGITNQNRFLSLWYQCHEVALARQGRSGAEIRDKNNQAKLMFYEFKKEFEKMFYENLKLKEQRTQAQKTLKDIKDLEGKLPWTTKILPGSSGSNTIYKIEYILGGGEPPIVIEEFSYPTQKSVRSRNAAIAKRLILLLLAQKPVEDDKVFEARKKVLKAQEAVEKAKKEHLPTTLLETALNEAKNKLEEAKVAAKENEESLKNKLYKNAPNLAEAVKQIAFLGKTGVRVYKTSKASSNGRKKRAFARAADCYGAIPVVLRATLASLEAGFAFNKEITREAI